jgi:hypothetical protein
MFRLTMPHDRRNFVSKIMLGINLDVIIESHDTNVINQILHDGNLY